VSASQKRGSGEVRAPAPARAPRGEGRARAGLDLLGFELDGVSWQSLEAEHPALAGAVQEVVGDGYSPQQIRQYVTRRGLPVEWARWLEQAARYVAALEDAGQ
jgi:hypothetical protein